MSDNPFEKVLDRLREKGWKKGGMGPDTGPNCIAGASQVTHAGMDYQFLERIIKEQYPDRIHGDMMPTPNFNDHPDTQFSDVERVLEKAAVKWEEGRVLRDG